jgi:hypothetical protein
MNQEGTREGKLKALAGVRYSIVKTRGESGSLREYIAARRGRGGADIAKTSPW